MLVSTKIECNGICMRCFRERNDGFRPNELRSIEGRGLSDLLLRWKEIVRRGHPNIRNPDLRARLHHTYSTIYQSVVSNFRSEHAEFDVTEIASALNDLRIARDDELKSHILNLDRFVSDFSKAIAGQKNS